jgi:serine/threonine-protein kinase
MSAELAPGSLLAGYRVLSLIARGGMGIVYLAEDTNLRRRVALKVLAPEFAENDAFRRRFTRESQLAASIDHPNIIPIYGAGEADRLLWIAMRYVQGTDLRAVLQQDGRLEIDRAISIVGQVGRALDAAHRQGLIHRDVKPGNIMLVAGASDDSPEHAYLGDFGLTKSSSDATLTQTGQFLGTVDYVAPEQIQGKAVDGRTDEYSLACVLFECLTGTVPFVKETGIAAIYAHLASPPPDICTIRRDLPPEFGVSLSRALAKEPDERYPSCAEMMATIRTHLWPALAPSPVRSSTASATAPAPPIPLGPRPASVPDFQSRDQGQGFLEHPSFPPGGAFPTVALQAPGTVPASEAAPKRPRRRRWKIAIGILVIGSLIGAAIPLLDHLRSHPIPVTDAVIVIKPDGTGVRTFVTGSDLSAPAWSPDGTQLAFSERQGTGLSDVYVVHVVGGQASAPTDLTPGTPNSSESDPAWSRDSNTIAFVSDRSGRDEIWTEAVGGSTPTSPHQETLDPRGVSAVSWSPTEDRLALVVFRSGVQGLAWRPLGGGSGSGNDSLADSLGSASAPDNPVWSPDGNSIAFDATGANGSRDVFAINADGSGLVDLTTASPAKDVNPAWSPDGKQLVFSSNRSARLDLWLMNADGSAPTRLTRDPADETAAVWSKDGFIAFVRRGGS